MLCIELPDPGLEEQVQILLGHFDAMIEHYGSDTGCRMARKHVAWYSKGLPGSAEFRSQVNHSLDVQEIKRLVRAFYEPLSERLAA